MQNQDICREFLGLEKSWSVIDFDVDVPSNRIDITLGCGTAKKKFFFGRTDKDYALSKVTLRHLPIAGMRTFLHLPDRVRSDTNQTWAAAGSHFTHEMEAYIVNALNDCHSHKGVARLTGITLAEAREISERTGAGIGVPAIESDISVSESSGSTATRSFELYQVGDVPKETNANWQRLIDGTLPLQANAVGLQMLLQRVRQVIFANPTEANRLAGIRLLREYFVKNQNMHKADIDILAGGVVVQPPIEVATSTVPSDLPADNNPCWRGLIDGRIRMQTSKVGLQMMLKRVRLLVEKDPSESTYLAAAKILRQFFLKHYVRLASELSQLSSSDSANNSLTMLAPQSEGVPAFSDPSWRNLINDELKLQTDFVGLQMMLERIRQLVARNSTESSYLAGAKVLHQFFKKHQRRLVSEIGQLNGLVTNVSANSVSGFDVPPESHDCWQKLINGDSSIQTTVVSLQMMLKRIRLSIQRNPTATNQKAGIKIMRQFFVKHKGRLQSETQQLLVVETTPMPISSHASIPVESNPIWQELISGVFEVKTDVVALKMMLERIRISIQRNPSDAAKLAGAKILRQYFIKHQHKHKAELTQLMAA